MTDPVETLIKDIAAKHGIAIGRDDPILILQSVNAQLMADNAQAQQAMLNHYQEALEVMLQRFGQDTKDRSERLVNASLQASKEAMSMLLQDGAQTTVAKIKAGIDLPLSQINNLSHQMKRAALFNLMASLLTFLAVGMLSANLLLH